jgi:hypothetical protein
MMPGGTWNTDGLFDEKKSLEDLKYKTLRSPMYPIQDVISHFLRKAFFNFNGERDLKMSSNIEDRRPEGYTREYNQKMSDIRTKDYGRARVKARGGSTKSLRDINQYIDDEVEPRKHMVFNPSPKPRPKGFVTRRDDKSEFEDKFYRDLEKARNKGK